VLTTLRAEALEGALRDRGARPRALKASAGRSSASA
jgi:hypothetical protein